MPQLFQHSALPVFALCSSFLILKMLVIGHLTGAMRFRAGAFGNPEDYDAFKVEAGEAGEAGAAHPDVERYQRAHHNDLESTLPFLALGMVYLATGPSSGLASGLIVGFTLLRTLFSIFYLLALQPWRSISFIGAELCLLVMLGQTAWWGFSQRLPERRVPCLRGPSGLGPRPLHYRTARK